jgi:hypothetical protein
MNLPEITLDDIRDRVISRNTNKTYLVDNFHFIIWLSRNNIECLTDHGVAMLTEFRAAVPNGSSDKVLLRRNKEEYLHYLRNAEDNHIIHLDRVTPRIFIDFVRLIRNMRNNAYLSRSAYGNRRAALFHLFRLHNKIGFSTEFGLELKTLLRGFFSTLAAMTGHARLVNNVGGDAAGDVAGGDVAVVNNVGGDVAGGDVAAAGDVAVAGGAAGVRNRGGRGQIDFDSWHWNSDESKRPMSVALLKKVCCWLLENGTPDSTMAHAYLLLTWNLCCRSNNTAHLKMADINWSLCFDSFCVFFSHSKTDQTGTESRYPRHIYANPVSPEVCPLLSLAMYFSTNFNTTEVGDCTMLFPGKGQETRFAKMLFAVLLDHVDEVRALGFELHHIGTHSIRKGAASFLSSLVGGPPAAAISVRGGWSMGNVKDRYFKYMESGDEYVGRCLCLLPMLTEEMASSPPWFDVVANSPDDINIYNVVCEQFSVCSLIVGFGRMCRMCLASLLYHRDWIIKNLNCNHCVNICSYSLRDEIIVNEIIDKKLIKVTLPWNDSDHVFTGVPPHVSLLQNLRAIRNDQTQMIDTFVDKVKLALTEYGVGSERFALDNIQKVLDDFKTNIQQTMQQHLQSSGRGVVNEDGVNNESNEREERNDSLGFKYKPHYYGGMWHRVPCDWRIPRCGTKDLWRQWWIGNTTKDRNVPPLRLIKAIDVKHIDKIPLTKQEMHRRTGKYKMQRRKAHKGLQDINALMRVLTKLVVDVGKMETKITITSVERMYKVISKKLNIEERDLQKMWSTVAKDVRLKRYDIG